MADDEMKASHPHSTLETPSPRGHTAPARMPGMDLTHAVRVWRIPRRTAGPATIAGEYGDMAMRQP